MVLPFSDSYPWLLPGAIVALVAAVLVSGPIGRWLGVSRLVAGVIIATVGVILAATLTPPGCACSADAVTGRPCDLSRTSLVSPSQLLASAETVGNLLAFVPLGFAIALVPRSRRRAAVLAGAVALPFAIEAVQLAVPALGRLCQSADVVDNLTGLVVGLVAGFVAYRLLPGLRAAARADG